MIWLAPLRRILTMLALVGALTGGLWPSGWMPQASADGFTLVICTGQGPVQIQVDAHGEIIESGDPSSMAGEAPCSFCSTAAAILSDVQPAPELVDRTLVRVSAVAKTVLIGPASGPPGPRGPPDGLKHPRAFA